jgi:hypothetical protein
LPATKRALPLGLGRVIAVSILLHLALLTIRLMRWLYNRRLLGYHSTDLLLLVAKRLRLKAERILAVR